MKRWGVGEGCCQRNDESGIEKEGEIGRGGLAALATGASSVGRRTGMRVFLWDGAEETISVESKGFLKGIEKGHGGCDGGGGVGLGSGSGGCLLKWEEIFWRDGRLGRGVVN